MRFSACIALLSVFALPAVATAQEAPAPASAPAAAIKSGESLKSSDGKRVGRIQRVVTDKAGAPVSAGIIIDSRMVYVPVSTISSSGGVFVTSLSRAEIRKLR